ncbi:hypothetical protein [Mesorhizobium sp. M1B.F.Ca.ET.045.04.1.1]|uniref:hypothetical protein n=1 Tax=Mesorhizobium sp. M1B.F.Ca.ET.045.04.1.1 TaxID=2493673 RepID=UPI000F75DA05|nr:hypothetical protein [Mesorhizobium sp. M1B.F.Ca.ET.045.04.1.1]AZO29368.1 hypothetical protein EJ071_19575 [Mesorhizobium sp. M1B.F.Ca.ET.045.04.1.1]
MIFEHDTKDHGGSAMERPPTAGQLAYEEDCRRCPRYADQSPRKDWRELPDYARASWEKEPTPREYGRSGL